METSHLFLPASPLLSFSLSIFSPHFFFTSAFMSLCPSLVLSLLQIFLLYLIVFSSLHLLFIPLLSACFFPHFCLLSFCPLFPQLFFPVLFPMFHLVSFPIFICSFFFLLAPPPIFISTYNHQLYLSCPHPPCCGDSVTAVCRPDHIWPLITLRAHHCG